MNLQVYNLFIRMAALLCAASVSAQTERPAELMPLAPQSLLLDITMAGDRAVAVGERGHVLLSDDYGRTWRQVMTSTRSTLTGVHFADSLNGWVVGHENIVLKTTDGGETWKRQFPQGPIEERYLDVRFLDAQRGLAVGAYGFARATSDGGRTWEEREISWEEMHLNRISQGLDGRLFIAVEGGALMTSADEGQTWEDLPSPYEGSLFGILPLGPRTLLTYGLRGHIFRSIDSGQTWTESESEGRNLIMHGIRHSSGRIILAGQNGQFVISDDGGKRFRIWTVEVQGASALVECPDGAVLAVGLNGVHRLTLPKARKPEVEE
ncbi:MAG: YCF48-related protein [Puniceicoccaceae bacterium]